MDIRIKKSMEVINHIIDDMKFENPKQFSEALGFKRPERIYKILRGESGVSRKLADIIHEKYPQYDRNWLLSGEGSLKKDEASKEPVANDEQDEYKISDAEINSIRQDIRAVNENLLALSEGMTKNFEVVSDGMFESLKHGQKLLRGQKEILKFVYSLNADEISAATARLSKFLEEQHE
ncbi:hypothetical protein JM79_2726 [Gramella sp. Hel_I_59]|uniref:hypothetical protein n=1 Tax=Gramella sp. Hel_I_59 TaxID=1249978 RepID=UPI001150E8F5|nr:hypothetical protein [Gramella sp. Hel_I_59]TQI71778.1 hypothetical protein JM79_2726 [Gramella sp. Hel_I_59]